MAPQQRLFSWSKTVAPPSLTPPLQSYSFNYMGQKLARRVRLLTIAALLRQAGRPGREGKGGSTPTPTPLL